MDEESVKHGECMTQREVAQALGLSNARIGQIEEEAMAKLRSRLAWRGIYAEDCCDGEVTRGKRPA